MRGCRDTPALGVFLLRGHNRGVGDMERLRGGLAERGRLVVAFSGGADSSLLAWVANDVLGGGAVAATAVSPSLAAAEHRDCAALADEWGLRWTEVRTEEMGLAAYRVNDGDRCYWCKDALMDALAPLAAGRSAVVALGVNTDDLGDHRPGQRAAAERGAVFPLVDAGFSKADVRGMVEAAGPADLGQARRSVPGLSHSLRKRR